MNFDFNETHESDAHGWMPPHRLHYHMTCKWCGWRTLRICFAGDKPSMEMRVEFNEHVSAVHRHDHPIKARVAEIACRLFAWSEMS